VVEEIYDEVAATAMGITAIGQVCIMIHCGSRGLGHQIATDYVDLMQHVMIRDNISIPDRQLACARIKSVEGSRYLKAMAAAANYAICNRAILTSLVRSVFEEIFEKNARELDMALIYDVSHNMAKIEQHSLIDTENGTRVMKKLLVHRKGATRAFPPGHPLVPAPYQHIGQPVLVGGSMGTCSHVLTGTKEGFLTTFGSTCHGAGRALSRTHCQRHLSSEQVLLDLKLKGITVGIANSQNVVQEAPQSYKDVNDVVETCQAAQLSKKAFKLKPICVIKG
jgi:tRNA-splicing ligase RtcB (3'-phosphate/5'-hydroxy nucleic acid ligase)